MRGIKPRTSAAKKRHLIFHWLMMKPCFFYYLGKCGELNMNMLVDGNLTYVIDARAVAY